MFTLTIKTGNAAYRDDEGNFNRDIAVAEIARQMTLVLEQLKHGYDGKGIIDINGNRVGEWELEE